MKVCKFISLLFCILFFAQKIYAQKNQNFKTPSLPVPLHLGPSCQFSVLNYCYGDTTYFINQTLRMMNPGWKIANSSGVLLSSLDTNLKYLFPSLGTYSVTLHADNGHQDSITKVIIIDTITRADFAFQPCSNQFVNTSSCTSSYFWNFGDSSTSTNPLPIHQYADTGYYNVTLIASNGQSADTLTQILYVDRLGYPGAAFTFIQSYDTVFFHASDSIADEYYWDFGDLGCVGTGRDSLHVYATPGVYDVSLFVQNQCGFNSSSCVQIYTGIIEQFTKQFNIAIFPNPLTNTNNLNYIIYSATSANTKITVYNLLGEKIIEFPQPIVAGINTGTLNISSLNSATYIITVDIGSKEKCFKRFSVIKN